MVNESEHVIQCKAVQWIKQYTPYVVYAVPNGGKRGKLEAMRLRAEGVLAGIPDLHIPALALYIEMKTAVGKVSPVQKDVHEQLRRDGQAVHVCRSLEDVQDIVSVYMERKRGEKPTRQPIKKVKP
jgi:hypothetical protein